MNQQQMAVPRHETSFEPREEPEATSAPRLPTHCFLLSFGNQTDAQFDGPITQAVVGHVEAETGRSSPGVPPDRPF